MADITPMMKQYLTIKEQYDDCILFFRLGDFYEMFAEDAKVAAEELELTLTTRDRGKENPEERTPMCGVPYHSSEAYIARLIAKGYKVAICEQMEDPALAKGLVSREVTRVVTPGTVIDSSMLEENRNNYICAVFAEGEEGAVCFADISTGELYATSFCGPQTLDHLSNELCRFSPAEALLSGAAADSMLTGLLRRLSCRCETGEPERFGESAARDRVQARFGTAQRNTLPKNSSAALRAVGGLLAYLEETQKTDLSHLNTLHFYTGSQFMELDYTARRNLELTETLRGKGKRGSLLWVLDKTKTAMGGRMLRSWLERPLLDPAHIEERQEAVSHLTADLLSREELLYQLTGISDLERLMGKVAYGTANGRDLMALAGGLSKVPALKAGLAAFSAPMLLALQQELDELEDVAQKISRTLVEDPPFSLREGGMIRTGVDDDIDRLRNIMEHGADMLAEIERGEREKTGIKNLKVRYNKVFGYYIEVSKSNYELVPEQYIRRQTLANCERFITQELKDLEHEILSAKDKITLLEYDAFVGLRNDVLGQMGRIQRTASAIAKLDVLLSFAVVAVQNHYCRPQVAADDRILIKDGRHPVVERMLRNGLFVPNDTELDGGEHCLAILTGPNMAGKSTYMRQVALIVLMAQAGSFVPAREAFIGVVDRIFTRIGASDDLSSGQSTFMVEMTEVAEILRSATGKSLLILDEIGRGTSTYDGMSIARAVLEYCADPETLGAKTLFATHYHELTELEGERVKNYNIAAKKRDDTILFLRKIVRGGADQSYGVEVAKLAGVPDAVVERAREILHQQEQAAGAAARPRPKAEPMNTPPTVEQAAEAALLQRLRQVDLNVLTPIEAMNLLFELKRGLTE